MSLNSPYINGVNYSRELTVTVSIIDNLLLFYIDYAVLLKQMPSSEDSLFALYIGGAFSIDIQLDAIFSR